MALCVQEPLPKPDRVPQLEALLSAKNEDDDEELERLALGLKVIAPQTWQAVQTSQQLHCSETLTCTGDMASTLRLIAVPRMLRRCRGCVRGWRAGC